MLMKQTGTTKILWKVLLGKLGENSLEPWLGGGLQDRYGSMVWFGVQKLSHSHIHQLV